MNGLLRWGPGQWAGLLLLSVAATIYWPGLQGGFIFDDWSNLALLGQFGQITNWEQLLLYVTSGFSGPTGRPLSHLSFLLDAQSWPAQAWPFKRTNLLLHLLNGVVLYAFLRQVMVATGSSAERSTRLALVAAGWWLLHPMWVSTTLYVVQRMAQLATLFCLLGLWWYTKARLNHKAKASPALAGHMVLAVWGGGVLAALSKENGVLLPLLVLLLEATVLAARMQRQPLQPTRGFYRMMAVLVGLPALAVAAYWLSHLPAVWQQLPVDRPYTAYERLLTQGRVLWMYVAHWCLPTLGGGSIYQDTIELSKGWWWPWTSAVAWWAWAGVAVWAWRLRYRQPLWALACLFFMVGHLLESTFIPLELYFEHRNYLPAALLALPLAQGLWPEFPKPGRPWWADQRVLVVLILAGLAAMTAQRAAWWGKPWVQATRWVQENPSSPRALHHLATLWQRSGHWAQAAALNQRAIAQDPQGMPWAVAAVGLACQQGLSPRPAIDHVLLILNTSAQRAEIASHQLDQLLQYLISGQCPSFTPQQTLALVNDLRSTALGQRAPTVQVLLWQREAQIYLQQDHAHWAVEAFWRIRTITDDPDTNLMSVAMLASSQQFQAALQLLHTLQPKPPPRGLPRNMAQVHQWYKAHVGYHAREMQRLEQALLDELKH